MELPAQCRLMADIEDGKIDIVVVYKIDRLARSLPGFARLVEVFDRYRVSFVSVIQQFNAIASVGRLTLNILLSFSQFEREVTGAHPQQDRRQQGQGHVDGWSATFVVMTIKDRTLIVNEREVALVREIFTPCAERGSVSRLVRGL